MSKLTPRQTSFAGGEWAPGLFGRSDLTRFASGCGGLLNFFVSPFGSLMNRPGTEHIAKLQKTLPGLDGKDTQDGRLVPFIFSDTDTLILVFLDGELQFFEYDSTLGTAVQITDGSSVVALVTPWDDAQLGKLRFSQVGDTVVIVEPGTQPYILKRLSSNNQEWTLEAVDFSGEPYPAWLSGDELEPRVYMPPNYDPTEANTGAYQPLFESEAAAPWRWAITHILEDADGNVVETRPSTPVWYFKPELEEWRANRHYEPTAPETYLKWCWIPEVPAKVYECAQESGSPVTGGPRPIRPAEGGSSYWTEHDWSAIVIVGVSLPIPEKIEVSAENPVKIVWEWWPSGLQDYDDPDSEWTVIATRVYRGQEGNFGFIGRTTEGFLVDAGGDPDYSTRPPAGENPFEDFSAGDFPSTVATYEGRRFYAAGTKVWGSAVEKYNDFDVVQPATDSHSLSFELATNAYELVRAVIAREGLLVLTDTSEWRAQGSGESEILTPNSIAARTFSRYGSSNLAPLEVNDLVLFMQRKGTVPRAISLMERRYRARDISVFSRHLFMGRGVVAWCFCEDPWSLTWVTTSDGDLLSCTLIPEEEMLAWAPHRIAGGTVEDVCSIPEGYEDTPYLLVRRGSDLHLERMASRVVTDARLGIFLDGAVHYDGRNTDTTTVQVDNTGHTERNYACQVTIVGEDVAGENLYKILRVHGADAADADDTDDTVLVRLDAHGGGVYTGWLLEDLPTAMDGAAFSEWSVCVTTVPGVAHLVGENCRAMVDGWAREESALLVDPYVCSATEETAAEIVTVGAVYYSDLQLLPVPDNAFVQKNVEAVVVELESSRPGYVGPDFDNLLELAARDVDHGWDPIPLERQVLETTIGDLWDTHAQAVYRQVDPSPVEILAFQRTIEVGGR